MSLLSQNIIKSAGVHETPFYAMFDIFQLDGTSNYHRHMQYKDKVIVDTHYKFNVTCPHTKTKTYSWMHPSDNHHSPITVDQYLMFRVHPVIKFYQSRLPGYYQSHSFSTVLVITSSLVGTK